MGFGHRSGLVVRRASPGDRRGVSLEQNLADLSTQLENPPSDPIEVRRLGKEYARLQDELDVKLSDWESLQA